MLRRISPSWSNTNDTLRGGKLATMVDVVDATQFLLRNRGVSPVNLPVDRGTVLV